LARHVIQTVNTARAARATVEGEGRARISNDYSPISAEARGVDGAKPASPGGLLLLAGSSGYLGAAVGAPVELTIY